MSNSGSDLRDPTSLKLLDPLNPLLAADRGKRLPALAGVTDALVSEIGATGMFSPATLSALRTVDSSGRVEAELLGRLERLAQSVRDDKEQRSDHASYGITRGLFPVLMDGVIVACLDTGPLKLGPWRPDETKELAKLTGVSSKELAPLEVCPSLNAKQVAGVLRIYKSLAAGFTQALDNQGQGGSGGLGGSAGASGASPGASSVSLAAGISRHYHKLLSVILGYTSCAIGRDDMPEDIAASIERVQHVAAEGKALAEHLFAVDGDGIDDQEDLNTPRSLHAAIELILPMLESHRSASIELAPELDAAADAVLVRRSDLHQLVFNLLTVAMDIAPLGSRITLQTQNNAGHHTGLTGPCVNIVVFDAKGQPFDELAPHLTMGLSAFGPVEDADLERRLSGMVRRVEALGGSVRIKPQPGRMTSIECALPVQAAVPANPAGSGSLPVAPGNRVWVVAPGLDTLCQDLLGREGHDVASLGGADAAMAKWDAGERPDLLILDYNLGEVDGGELRAWFAERGETPVILLSSLPSVHPGIEDALQLPRTHYLHKPIGQRDLAETVSLALGLTLIG